MWLIVLKESVSESEIKVQWEMGVYSGGFNYTLQGEDTIETIADLTLINYAKSIIDEEALAIIDG